MVPLGPAGYHRKTLRVAIRAIENRAIVPPTGGAGVSPAYGRGRGMDKYTSVDEPRAEDEIEAQEPGSTYTLTQGGWEVSEYVDPADDWSLLSDGSYLSPDGTVRTWPLVGPEPEVS